MSDPAAIPAPAPAATIRPVLLVTGDLTVDWTVIAPPDMDNIRAQFSDRWEPAASAGISAQPGGAALLSALLSACNNQTPQMFATVLDAALPESALRDPGDGDVTRTYSFWSPHPAGAGSRGSAWRVREWLGQWPARAGTVLAESSDRETPDVLVIDDTNHGFRDAPQAWPRCLRHGADPPGHVFLRMANPLAQGALWERLIATVPERLTVCLNIGDLRREFAPVGQPLSWERTARDVVKSIHAHPALVRAERVVVALGLAGAVLIERERDAALIYDPAHQEGDWERARPGIPFAVGACVTAALALAPTHNSFAGRWRDAVTRGLRAARTMHEHGFVLSTGDEGGRLAPPLEQVAAVLAGDENGPFRAAAIPADDNWKLLSMGFPEGELRTAARIALEGIDAAAGPLPVERMGAWASVDRAEIESMRSVRNIVREYLQQPRRSRPLSLAVFGPPGAGKSFAIKQMAGEWTREGTAISVLEFNVSQFADMAALSVAFQQIRDAAVQGTLPLVFWDEFDSRRDGQEMGWLAQFLAPMQDGAFLDHGALRPIGAAIFVFAGGTHPTMAGFKARAEQLSGAKATDFLSRLRGYIDILGPNANGPDDRTYPVRRALLLRPLLERRAPRMVSDGRLNIDPGVLRAFLEVERYVHGARSMESIVEMSALAGRPRFERSALPARHQLALHVDADAFLDLVAGE